MTDAAKAKPHKHQESVRDTVESILFALVLAFLFRTFEAEAFVIPTGSMAPTLYGRHKETTCQQCGYRIVVGASDEVNPKTGYLLNNARVKSALCPNCQFENTQIFGELAFNGDRILVNKFTYEFWEPTRWDVFVFKWPVEPDTNYIKRLVGLPGETIRIRNGNLYLWDGQREQILRKDPYKQRCLQIPVYDDNHVPRALIEAGWPHRWASVKPSQDVKAIGGWQEEPLGWSRDDARKAYAVTLEDQPGGRLQWLRYRHIVPQPHEWQSILQGRKPDPKGRLVGDFCGYNAYTGSNGHFEAMRAQKIDPGIYWVPDLTVTFKIDLQAVHEGGELLVELVEGVLRYRCRIDCTSGEAVLEEVNEQLNGRVKELGRGTTAISGAGSHRISFANVDDRLCLWVDNKLIDFDEGALVDQSGATSNQLPTQADLSPAGIAASGIAATVSDLLLERDIYYRADFLSDQPQFGEKRHFESDLTDSLYDPQRWAEIYHEHADRLDTQEIVVPEDHYLALGDNSPRSRDSRLWEDGMQTVPRRFLVGKAFWIYWPHGIPFLNGGRGFTVVNNHQHANGNNGQTLTVVEDYPKHTVPFYPQFWRMKRIR